MTKTLQVSHYSDVLCVWAYIAHVRTQELQHQFPQQLDWTWRYLPIFGDTQHKFSTQWQGRGGVFGYADHVDDVLKEFDHVKIDDRCWRTVQPTSSTPAHLWLSATRVAAQNAELPPKSEEDYAWALRRAFFEQGRDISQQDELTQVAKELGFETSVLANKIKNGTAFAALSQDIQQARDANIRISPTYVFNEDRQRLTGNVGYRIIEANVKELLEQPDKQHSWC